MDSRAADSLFGGADDGHDFFTSLDGANASPKQSVQQSVVEYPQSAPSDSNTAGPYSSAPLALTAQANHTQDPYAQAANHAQAASHARAASSYDPYSPPYASHSAATYQPTGSVPSQPAATPSAPYTTPAATSSMTTAPAPAHDPYAPVAPARPAATTPYMSSHSYNPTYTPAIAAAPSPYAPSSNMVPPPPAPKTVDASQFRVKPNAYDPPIRDVVPARSASRIPPTSVYSTPYSPPANHAYGAPAYATPPPRTPSIPPPPPARMTPPPHQSSQAHPPPIRPPSAPQPPRAIPPPPAHRNSLDSSSTILAPATSTTSYLSTNVHGGAQYIPRTSSPLVPRPTNGTGSPRPPSVAATKPVHSPPPRAPSVVSSAASQSRPSSAASNPYAPLPRGRPSISSASPTESSGRVSTNLPSPTSQAPPLALVPPLESEEPLATARPNDGVNPFNIIPPSSENLAGHKPTQGPSPSQTGAIPNTTSSLPTDVYHDGLHANAETKPEEYRLGSLEDLEDALRPQPNEIEEAVEHEKERSPSPPLDPYAPVIPVRSAPIPQPSAQPPADPYTLAQPRKPTDPYAPTYSRQPTDPSHSRKSTGPYAPRQDLHPPVASVASGPPRRQTLEGVRTPPPAPASVLDLTHSPSPPRAVKPLGQTVDPYRPTAPTVPPSGPPVSAGAYQPLSTYQPMQPPLPTYQPVQPVPPPSQPIHEPPAEQYVTVPSTLSSSHPHHNMYAPSPSLLGTNDPLGRTSFRVPVVSFGFGGKLVLCFHKNPAEAGGFDTAMSARPATQISLKPVKDAVPSSMTGTQTHAGTPYPGPLFCDQAPAAAGMLAGAAANTKAKKAALLQWLGELAAEAEREVGYVGNDSAVSRAKAEGKSVLIKLLKVLVENEGKLTGRHVIPTVEAAVRTALLGAAPESFAAGDMLTHGFAYPGTGGPGLGGHSTAVATYQVKTASLDHLQELLIRGERRKAYQYASDEKLWAHALLIASSLDKAAWKEVVSEFIQAELGVLAGMDSPINAPSANKRESLRVAYGLIAGDSAAAVKQLVPPRLLGQVTQTNTLVPGPPIPPKHASAALTGVPTDVLVQWKEVLAAIYSNHNAGDDTPLTALGDQLVAKQWIEAAHCCYLLASGLSSISGTTCPAPRIALFGSEHPAQARSFHTDLLPVILSEVAEYGLSLTPPMKGQETYHGLPHLQVYRFWHAACLAETGDISLALRYIEAISATLRISTRASPHFTPTFVEQLKDLHDRLTGAPHGDRKNFLSKAIPKPNMETFNTWIAGGLTKLIEGDEPTPQPQDQQAEVKPASGATLGPFSHYSTISSNAPSKSPSPAPSFTSVHGMSTIPPPRTASTGGYRPPANGLSPMPVVPLPDRSASATDHTQTINRKPSIGPKVLSAKATTSTFSQAYENGYTPYNSDQMNSSSAEDAAKIDAGQETGAWWGSSNDGTTAKATPTAATFLRVHAGELPDGDGPQFISLGDNDTLFTPSVTPSIAPSSPQFTTAPSSYDEEEDLGLGNSKPKKKGSAEEKEDLESTSSGPPKAGTKAAPAPPPPKVDPKKEEVKSQNGTTSGGWFGWFRKSDTPKPVKANLGKESSFYYDPDIGRWVNKAADAGDTAPKAPPPPPRAQTVSPGKSTSAVSTATATPPPPRAASVIPSSSAVAPPPRPNSTLSGANSLAASITSGPPLGSKAGTPPPPRAMGQTPPPGGPAASGGTKAAKRNPRSRYVDVFQQQT